MSKQIIFLALLFNLCTQAASIDGEIKFTYEASDIPKNAFKREFGDVVKAECNWYVGDFFGQETVFAGITVKNTGARPMYFRYYVAFFDQNKKLVGTAAQGSFGEPALKVGGKTQLGSCLVYLPKARYKDIASYQAVVYETDTPSKKKQ